MAAQLSVSQLFGTTNIAELGVAHEQHKHEEPQTNMGLPAGIRNGIAQLWTCKLDLHKDGDNKGKPYFYTDGRVKFPAYHENIKVEGQVTKIIAIPLYDTPDRTEGNRTKADHFAKMQEVLKLLAGKEKVEAIVGGSFKPGTQEYAHKMLEQYLALMAWLEKVKPYFRFETWSSGRQEVEEANGNFYVTQNGKRISQAFQTMQALKNKYKYVGTEPMVNHKWGPACEWKPTVTTGAGVNELPNGTPTTAAPSVSSADRFDQMERASMPSPDAPSEPTTDAGFNMQELAERAEAKDEDAIAALSEAAIELGATQDWLDDGADNWFEVAQFIQQKADEAAASEALEPIAS